MAHADDPVLTSPDEILGYVCHIFKYQFYFLAGRRSKVYDESMGRALCLEVAGACYGVLSRGNERRHLL